jgi:ubiquinone/menaquinone biosynthesis C-methylase UbiE
MERDKEQAEIQMIKQCADLPGKRVLEIGCGDGRVTSHLAGKAQYITAIDPDAESITRAKSNIAGVDFKIGSGEYIDYKSGSFDLILFTLSLHHQEYKRSLQEAHRVLKKNGLLLILEPSIDSEVLQYFNLFNDETRVLKSTLSAVEASDFKQEKKEYFFTDWTFEDKEELYDYFFEYHTRLPSEYFKGKINELLNLKTLMHPITLKDKVLIMSLRKKA